MSLVSVLMHDHHSHAGNCNGLFSNTALFLSTHNIHFPFSTPRKPFDSMLEGAADQTMEIRTSSCRRAVQNLEFVLQQMHTALMALTSYEANDIVVNSRKNPLKAWRRLQKRCDPTTGGRKRNLLRTIISPGRCSHFKLCSVSKTVCSGCSAV